MNSAAAASAAEEATRRRSTVSQTEQWAVQDLVFRIYSMWSRADPNVRTALLELNREEHIQYLTNGLRHLGPAFVSLDANRPWLCYWMLHSLALLGESLDDELENNAIDFLNRCQDPNGGYGGGPGQ
ncbi:hypothetical protein Tsubulata_045530, partial [Turnera subulata]